MAWFVPFVAEIHARALYAFHTFRHRPAIWFDNSLVVQSVVWDGSVNSAARNRGNGGAGQ